MRRYLFVGPALLALLWSILSYGQLVKPLFLPPPHEVGFALWKAAVTGKFWAAVGLTVYRWIAGVALGSVLGTLIGLVVGNSERLETSVEMPLDFFRSLPAMALLPLFLLVFGVGDESKIAVAAWASFLFVTVNTTYGVRYSRVSRLLLARILRASPIQTLLKITLPGALPSIFAGLRISISLGLVVVIATEMVMGTTHGLGKRILDDALIYRMDDMYASIIVAGAIGYVSNKASVVAERRFLHWVRE